MKRIVKGIFGVLFLVLLMSSVGCDRSLRKVTLTGEVEEKEYLDLDGSSIVIKNIRIADGINIKPVSVKFVKGTEKKIVVRAQKSFFDILKIKAIRDEITIEAGVLEKYETEKIEIEVYGYKFNSVSLAQAEGIINQESLGNDVVLDISGASSLTVDYVNLTRVEAIASGASHMRFNEITADILRAEVSGASKIVTLKTEVATADSYISGASTVLYDGSCGNAKAKVSGASTYEASGLKTDNVTINLSGSSTGRIYAEKSLEYSISGSSTLRYKGNANVVEKERSGASSVAELDDLTN